MEKFLLTTLGVSAGLLATATTAQAITVGGGTLSQGTYSLKNHIGGEAAPPLYGLRLDGLDGDVNSTVTFDFDAPGSDMKLSYNAGIGQIRIFGTAVGGVDTGNSYDPNWSDTWLINYTYNNVTSPTASGDDDLIVGENGVGVNGLNPGGTISSLNNNLGDFVLGAKAGNGGENFEFRLGDEDNDLGHKGETDMLSGWGWLTHDGLGTQQNVEYSDWLFAVDEQLSTDPAPGVPEPVTILGTLLAGSVGAAMKKRQKQQDA